MKSKEIIIEATARHVHLTKEAVNYLFDDEYKLTLNRSLSQPGQFLCSERLCLESLVNGRQLHNVAIIGPERNSCQVEISKTDSIYLGIDAPIRMSGDFVNSVGIALINESSGKRIYLDYGVIIPKRHVHLHTSDALRYCLKDKSLVNVEIKNGDRPLIFCGVEVRVNDAFKEAFHIDTDEGNACGIKNYGKGIMRACKY